MTRWICVLVWLASVTRADAAMMTHGDLASLVLESDAVVVADRLGDGPKGTVGEPTSRYKIVRVLRGQITDLSIDVWDHIYVTSGVTFGGTGQITKSPADARVVMFLTRRDNQWRITQSGLRVVADGKVFRFEQHSNPGPYEMVPQGPDPDDTWGASGAQLDMAGLEKAIAAAGKRVDALVAATKLTDAARRHAGVLALFGAPGRPASDLQFYVDRFSRDAREALGKAGDLEGALMVEARDRTTPWLRGDFAPLPDLVAYASDASHPAELRALAVGACARHRDYTTGATAVRAMIALVTDPDPGVRAAAFDAAARPGGVMSSDKAEQKLIDQLAREAKAAIAKQFAVEQDNRVLDRAIEVFEDHFRTGLPPRKAEPLVAAHVRPDGPFLLVEVRCLRPGLKLAGGTLVATPRGGKPAPVAASSVALHCGSWAGGTDGPGKTALPAGHYTLAVELTAAKQPVTLPLGEVDVDAAGTQILDR